MVVVEAGNPGMETQLFSLHKRASIQPLTKVTYSLKRQV